MSLFIVLLKGSSGSEDESGMMEENNAKYERELAEFSVHRQPVLKFEFLPQAITTKLASEIDEFDAVLMTSSRSALALHEFAPAELKAKLAKLPWYVVGEASMHACKHLLQVETVMGSEYGCARDLTNSKIMHKCKNVAYLCGNLRKSTMADGMLQAGIRFTEFILYETVPDLQARIPHAQDEANGQRRTCVFFSPSGVTAVGNQVEAGKDLVIAIGDTTNQALMEANITVHAVASSPSPAGLREAVLKAAAA